MRSKHIGKISFHNYKKIAFPWEILTGTQFFKKRRIYMRRFFVCSFSQIPVPARVLCLFYKKTLASFFFEFIIIFMRKEAPIGLFVNWRS